MNILLFFSTLIISTQVFALSGSPNSCVNTADNVLVEVGGSMTSASGVTKCCNANPGGDALWGNCAGVAQPVQQMGIQGSAKQKNYGTKILTKKGRANGCKQQEPPSGCGEQKVWSEEWCMCIASFSAGRGAVNKR